MPPTAFDYTLWAGSAALELSSFALALHRGLYHRMPVFTAYLGLVVARESLQLLLLYGTGSDSAVYFYSFWWAQAVLLATRGLVVAELCWVVLARYRGVWLLARVILGLTAALLVAFASIQATGRAGRPEVFVPAAERGLEMAVVGALVLGLVICRYYGIHLPPPVAGVALGLGLYSSITIINNSLLWIAFIRYSPVWAFIRRASFQAAVLIWIGALVRRLPQTETRPALAGPDVYASLTPEVSGRMRELNQRLLDFLGR